MIAIRHNRVWYSIIVPLIFFVKTEATVVAKGNGTGGLTFNAPVSTKAYDRTNRTLYVGLNLASSTDKAYAISYLYPASGITVPIALPLNPTASTSTKISFLALVTSEGERTPDVAFIPGTTNNIPDLTGKQVNVITFNGTFLPMPTSLVDATTINTVGGTAGLAANRTHIFTPVFPSGNTSYGALNSGIAVVSYINNNTAIAQTSTTKLDPTTPQIQNMTANPSFTALSASTPNNITLTWDDYLQRLYIGVDISTASGAGNGAIDIVSARIVNGLVVLDNFVPATALSAAVDTNIVGAIATMATTTKRVGIRNIRPMRTSAGPHYLIVNGGNGSPGNTIYALPLVNLFDATNPQQGTLAAKNSYDPVTKQFITPAATNAELVTTADSDVLVGQGPLPIQSTKTISDIVVVQDTVYVSLDIAQDANNEPGIFYSQALFNDEGRIVFWTPWSKRAFPVNGFTLQSTANKGRVTWFDVDAVNAKLWAITNQPTSIVATTTWDYGTNAGTLHPTSLAGNLNKALSEGCFSALDLDNNTQDFFTVKPPYRYALFGGHNNIVFTVTSAQLGANLFPQTVTSDFSVPTTLLNTVLPENPGCVTTLAYSQQNPPTLNYFFAGTQRGLFVFANNTGAGFLTTALSTLNLPPFSTGTWQKVASIKGPIVSLKASSNGTTGVLYILTTQFNDATTFKSTLYSVPYQATVAAMFAPANIRILAESGVTTPNSDLGNTVLFSGIENVSDGSLEQIILTTNNGIFASQADTTGANLGILSAINQDQAVWTLVDEPDQGLYTGVFAPIASPKSTTWPIACVAGPCDFFQQSTPRQLSLLPTSVNNNVGFSPFNFTADQSNLVPFTDPILNFWSDGARRLFILKRNEDPGNTKLLVFPFNTTQWGITTPPLTSEDAPFLPISSPNPDFYVITEPPLNVVQTMYWTQHIGVTGILMMGTNNGVLALE